MGLLNHNTLSRKCIWVLLSWQWSVSSATVLTTSECCFFSEGFYMTCAGGLVAALVKQVILFATFLAIYTVVYTCWWLCLFNSFYFCIKANQLWLFYEPASYYPWQLLFFVLPLSEGAFNFSWKHVAWCILLYCTEIRNEIWCSIFWPNYQWGLPFLVILHYFKLFWDNLSWNTSLS